MRIQRQEEEEVQRTVNSNVDINIIPDLRAAEHAPPPYDGSKESVYDFSMLNVCFTIYRIDVIRYKNHHLRTRIQVTKFCPIL